MSRLLRHLKTAVFRGFLVLLPLALSFLVLRFLYLAVDQRVSGLLETWIGRKIPGLGILLVLIILYLLGLLAGNLVGRRFLAGVDRISGRVPLVRTTYKLGKQLGNAFSSPGSGHLKRVVLVEQFRPGVWSVGFVTGHMTDPKTGEKLVRLFLPQGPNPTSGFMVIVREAEVRPISWTVPEAMNAIISGGISAPDQID
jgi:uncharacterized membrane protein